MRIFALSMASAALAGGAFAAPVSYDFVASSPTYVGANDATSTTADTLFALGTITGTIVFDDVLQQQINPNLAAYNPAVLNIDGFDNAMFNLPSPTVRVANDAPGFGDVVSFSGGFGLGGLADGNYATFGFRVQDDDGTAWSNTSFPTVMNLADFESAVFQFRAFSITNLGQGAQDIVRERVDFTLTSLLRTGSTPPPIDVVPLPAGLPLMIGGLMAFGLLRRRG
ncbi:MAG: VPLPA-CTERM sorting domain-containing protein [Pseudomonadota bacterium]